MSTKTTFKRIALVAVASLGFGMLSVVPSNAVVVAHTMSIDAATDTVAVNETATALITQSFIAVSANDSVTVQAAITSTNAARASVKLFTFDSSTSDSTVFVTPGGTQGSSTLFAGSATQNLAVNHRITAQLYNPTAAGTYTVTIYATPSNAGAAASGTYTTILTWTVTVTALDLAASTGTSILRVYGSGDTSPWGGTAATSDSTVVGAKALGTAPRATIWTTQTNPAGTADESLTAVISGPGYITTSTAATVPTVNPGSGFAVTVKNGNPIYVWANGTAGEATITVKTVSGVTLGTESVKFYGDVTKLAVTSVASLEKLIGLAGVSSTISNTQSSAFSVTATDALGTGVPLTALTCTSSNGAVVSSCTAAITTPGQHRGVFGISFTTSTTSTSGQAATLTVSTPDPASTTTPAATLSVTKGVTTGGTIATEVISLHATDLTAKSTFSPGEAMVVAITAKDASGNPVVDGSPTPTTISANKQIGGANNSNVISFGTYLGGMVTTRTISAVTGAVVRADLYYAPSASGDFTITGVSGNATSSRLSVTGTVGDDAATTAAAAAGDAAAEATDAANAATDAANAAAEAADAATAAAQDAADAVAALATSVTEMVNALKKQITSLTNLVIKIQKKVRA